MKKAIQIKASNYQRIIVISDIHGHYDIFNTLLSKVNLSKNDLLIINGDVINKGHNSLKLLRQVMQMSKKHNVIVIKGNHESFMHYYLKPQNSNSRFLVFLKRCPYNTLASEMADNISFNIRACDDCQSFCRAIYSAYRKEIDFLEHLPIYVETEEHIFVHSGYEEHFDVEKEEERFLKYDNFNGLTGVHKKTIVVGHWPASNIRKDVNTNLPYFNWSKNIITIDGGMGIKINGEINALIIRPNLKDSADKYQVIQANHFIKSQIIKAHYFEPETICFVNYPHFNLEMVKKGKILSVVRHLHSGKKLSIFNDLIYQKADALLPKVVYINRFFNLSIGQQVELCATFKTCHLVKYDDVFGWVLKEQIEI